MPKRVDFKTQRDFTGGLNLARSQVQLRDDETPDLLNVDVDARGGFGLRRGLSTRHSVLAAAPHSLLDYSTSAGAHNLLVGAGTALYRWDGAAWQSIFTGGPSGPYNSVTFKDRIYVLSGNNSVRRWDGSSSVTMTEPAPASYNDSLGTPTVPPSNGKFPKALVGAAFMGSMFVANLTENGTAYGCRVRWSHPSYPEDWRSTDYIDIEPEDGDTITALVPMGDRLLVFKHHSVHAIYGAPPESLSVTPVSREFGCPHQRAACGTDLGVFFWDENDGAHLLDIKNGQARWVGERLYAAIEDGRITTDSTRQAQCGWLNRRFWVSVPYDTVGSSNCVFVYDPFCGKDGAWTKYDMTLGAMLSLPQEGSIDLPLACSRNTNYVLQLEIFDTATDNYGSGATHISSHYVTRWWDQGEPVVRKRWKRPEAVVLGGTTLTMNVNVLRDYDPTTFAKSFTIGTTADATSGVWDSGTWDSSTWGRAGGERDEIVRGSPLGNARAVALRFEGPSTNVPWRVDALTMKWVSKRVRN